MPRVSAAGHLLRKPLGGSAAATVLRAPRPPARPPSARQHRHLGTGSAGRAATGRREDQGSAVVRVREAVCAATGRREDPGRAVVRVRVRGAVRAEAVLRVAVQADTSATSALASLFFPSPLDRGVPDPHRHPASRSLPSVVPTSAPPRLHFLRLLSRPRSPLAVLEKCLFV